MNIEPLVISAPFGNYIRPKGSTPTLGTFTAKKRPGRWRRVAQTVRYYPGAGAWVNRIGLRNPGIDALKKASNSILSIHGFTAEEWDYLLREAPDKGPLALELNLSCPNVPGGDDYPPGLFRQAIDCGLPVIVKLPPVNYEAMLIEALVAGVTWFHATNTLPTDGGGISGKPLKPVALAVVRAVRSTGGDKIGIIGGGGITSSRDITDYAVAGADRFAVGSGALWRWRLGTLITAARRQVDVQL